MRWLLWGVVVFVVVVLLLLPVPGKADTVYLPSIQNGPRNWFEVEDVVRWQNREGHRMPIWCTEVQPGIFTQCTVIQLPPLELVWDEGAGEVVARPM